MGIIDAKWHTPTPEELRAAIESLKDSGSGVIQVQVPNVCPKCLAQDVHYAWCPIAQEAYAAMAKAKEKQ